MMRARKIVGIKDVDGDLSASQISKLETAWYEYIRERTD